ncbi:MAG: hypothetical protein HQL03_00565 [Nitrospirae bacterium]|nr:hypothetical protein [Nitrospirota bacterium]
MLHSGVGYICWSDVAEQLPTRNFLSQQECILWDVSTTSVAIICHYGNHPTKKERNGKNVHQRWLPVWQIVD